MTRQAQHRRAARTQSLPTDGVVAGIIAPRSESSTRPLLTHEGIARRAYELYLERGSDHGRDQEDWFRATQELEKGSSRQMVDDVAPDTSTQATN